MSRDINSEWYRSPPTTIDWRKLWKRHPKHKFCNWTIKVSETNPTYTGFYCAKHGTLLTWINPYQKHFLLTTNTDIVNQTSDDGDVYV